MKLGRTSRTQGVFYVYQGPFVFIWLQESAIQLTAWIQGNFFLSTEGSLKHFPAVWRTETLMKLGSKNRLYFRSIERSFMKAVVCRPNFWQFLQHLPIQYLNSKYWGNPIHFYKRISEKNNKWLSCSSCPPCPASSNIELYIQTSTKAQKTMTCGSFKAWPLPKVFLYCYHFNFALLPCIKT